MIQAFCIFRSLVQSHTISFSIRSFDNWHHNGSEKSIAIFRNGKSFLNGGRRRKRAKQWAKEGKSDSLPVHWHIRFLAPHPQPAPLTCLCLQFFCLLIYARAHATPSLRINYSGMSSPVAALACTLTALTVSTNLLNAHWQNAIKFDPRQKRGASRVHLKGRIE